MTDKYCDINKCPECGGRNTVDIKDQVGPDICEASTECKKCHHKDFWAYGWFESLSDY